MNAGPQEPLRGACFLECSAQEPVECRDMLWSAVGQPAIALAPDIFGGVEFRCVRRKRFDAEPGVPPDELLNFPTAMNGALIPKEDHRPGEMSEQMPEEPTDIQPVEAAGLQAQIQRQATSLGSDRQRTDGGDVPLFIEVPSVRRLALGRPGTLKVRDEQEPTLVEEGQMRSKPIGVFLYVASGTASNERWPVRPVAGLGAPAFDSSSPAPSAASRHAPGGRSPGSASRSVGRSVPASTSRWRIPRPARPSRAVGPLAASGRATAERDGPVPVEGAGPPSHASGSLAATETPS